MFVTPYDRGDLQDLANTLDDAMDEIEEATDLIVLHDVKEFPQGLSDLVDAVRRLAELTASSMTRLKNLKDLDHYYAEADRIETEGDRIHRRVHVVERRGDPVGDGGESGGAGTLYEARFESRRRFVGGVHAVRREFDQAHERSRKDRRHRA